MPTKLKKQAKHGLALIRLLTFTGPSRCAKASATRESFSKHSLYRSTYLILLVCTLFPGPVQAQETGRSAVTVGYFGETVTHPGLFAGYEHNLRPQKRYQLLLAATVGGYVHRRNHAGLFSEVGLGQRLHFRSGFFLEQFIGIGYLHTFLNGGPIYEVNDKGEVSERNNLGRPHLMPSISLGFGWNVAHSEKLPLLVFVRPRAFWQYPFNSYALPHLALQAGITKVIR
ncbi:MAG TPA: hypothetical protein VF690_02495 [Hymenobacter sp.]|jgi:hypothetical protein